MNLQRRIDISKNRIAILEGRLAEIANSDPDSPNFKAKLNLKDTTEKELATELLNLSQLEGQQVREHIASLSVEGR